MGHFRVFQVKHSSKRPSFIENYTDTAMTTTLAKHMMVILGAVTSAMIIGKIADEIHRSSYFNLLD
jgi:DNA-binding phage protein